MVACWQAGKHLFSTVEVSRLSLYTSGYYWPLKCSKWFCVATYYTSLGVIMVWFGPQISTNYIKFHNLVIKRTLGRICSEPPGTVPGAHLVCLGAPPWPCLRVPGGILGVGSGAWHLGAPEGPSMHLKICILLMFM